MLLRTQTKRVVNPNKREVSTPKLEQEIKITKEKVDIVESKEEINLTDILPIEKKSTKKSKKKSI